MTERFPFSGDELTVEHLDALVHTVHPGVSIVAFEVTGSHVVGDGNGAVSTAGRISVEVEYRGDGAAELPTQLVIKVSRPDLPALPLYRNEVAFYRNLRPELGSAIESPRCVGANFDESSGTFGLALEDLTIRGATFPSVKTPVSIAQLQSIIDSVATLHARFWESPRFATDLSWVQTHVAGELHDLFNRPGPVPAGIERQLATQQFKRELVQMVGQTGESLYLQTRRAQAHQATLPRTQVHGDLHIGNTYLLPGDRGGFVDLQLAVRGYCIHDLAYLLVTGLSIEQRRAHERNLLAYYRDRLGEAGLDDVPDLDTIWLEYRRAAVWGVYIGWLTTPVGYYDWEICVTNLIRLLTAYADLETADALADLPDA
jgi:hypothetical protein